MLMDVKRCRRGLSKWRKTSGIYKDEKTKRVFLERIKSSVLRWGVIWSQKFRTEDCLET